ncbi:MAG: hypothetical protein AAF351_15320 [Pseudomonadota bacterium]
MIYKKKLALLLAIGTLLVAHTDATASADPLFADDSVIEVTIRAPLKRIMQERPDEDYVAGTFEYVDNTGATVALDVGIRTRGEYRRRRDVCPFAPLRINFQKQQVDGTVFDGQDKLKLVTHCRSGHRGYVQSVLGEYLAYRMLNALTDMSFRARLIKVKYVYTDDDDEKDSYAFFIEHKDALSKRLDLAIVKSGDVKVSAVEPVHLNLTSLFQYLIGNTDFSPVATLPGEDCCHNYVLFGSESEPLISIPYDFDQSGMADAPHAAPNPRFELSGVHDRLYRGRCPNNDRIDASIQTFLEHRDTLFQLIEDAPGFTNKARKDRRKFTEEFYETIEKDKRVDIRIRRACI